LFAENIFHNQPEVDKVSHPAQIAHTIRRKTMTRTLKTPRATVLRALALACVPIWLGAIFLCSSHCSHAEADGSHSHEHATVASHHDHCPAPDNDNHGDSHNSFCDSLNSATLSSGKLAIDKPHLTIAFVSALFLPAPGFQAKDTKPLSFRQAKPPDFVLTPEVCLGPAFRSLAPP
jgi:hypothetical protein